MRKTFMMAMVLLACVPILAEGPVLSLGSKTVDAGRAVNVEVVFHGGTPVASLTTDVTYDASALTLEGVETSLPGKVAAGNLLSPGIYRLTIYGGEGTLSEGVVATLHFRAAVGACGTYLLNFASAGPSAASPGASPVSMAGKPGTIVVEGCRKRAAE